MNDPMARRGQKFFTAEAHGQGLRYSAEGELLLYKMTSNFEIYLGSGLVVVKPKSLIALGEVIRKKKSRKNIKNSGSYLGKSLDPVGVMVF